jgi:hypothetical protein
MLEGDRRKAKGKRQKAKVTLDGAAPPSFK